MNKKELKYQKTNDKIKNSYMTLLSKKPSSSITVSEICKMADINRTSFYIHYEDIAALNRSLEEDAEKKVAKLFSTVKFDGSFQILINELFRIIKEDPMLFTFIFKEHPNNLSNILNKMKSAIALEWKKNSKLKEAEIDAAYEFLVFGFQGALINWIDSGMKNEEDLKHFFIEVIKDGYSHFIYKTSDKECS